MILRVVVILKILKIFKICILSGCNLDIRLNKGVGGQKEYFSPFVYLAFGGDFLIIKTNDDFRSRFFRVCFLYWVSFFKDLDQYLTF